MGAPRRGRPEFIYIHQPGRRAREHLHPGGRRAASRRAGQEVVGPSTAGRQTETQATGRGVMVPRDRDSRWPWIRRARGPRRRAMRRSSRMTSEATSRVPVVAHRLAATPKLLDEIARPCPLLRRSVTLLVPSPTRSRRPTPRPDSRQACRYSRRPQVRTGWGEARWPGDAPFAAIPRRGGSRARSHVGSACVGR
jgi:hypothetical protein